MRPASLFVLVLVAAALGGCAHSPSPRVAAASASSAQSTSAPDLDSLAYGRPTAQAVSARAQAMPAPVAAILPAAAQAAAFDGDLPYALDTGDRVRVVVFGQDGISNSYVVDASGAITVPLIDRVQARGLTTEELARAVADRLRRGFVREPHVAIEVETYRPFFILGEVVVPGQYAYVPHMSVESAVAIAGGFTPRAYRWEIKIDRPISGGIVRTTVPPQTRVRPGDTIVIKERWF